MPKATLIIFVVVFSNSFSEVTSVGGDDDDHNEYPQTLMNTEGCSLVVSGRVYSRDFTTYRGLGHPVFSGGSVLNN